MSRRSDGLFNALLRTAASLLIGAGASLGSLAAVNAQTGPLVIARQGYFFVGGRIEPQLQARRPSAICMSSSKCRRSSPIPIQW